MCCRLQNILDKSLYKISIKKIVLDNTKCMVEVMMSAIV
jgi:hypothetical protein